MENSQFSNESGFESGQETNQDDKFLYYQGDDQQRREIGIGLHPEVSDMFTAFNREIQDSNLPGGINIVTLTAIECIKTAKDCEIRCLVDKNKSLAAYFRQEMLIVNTEVHWMIRNYKGISGFFTKMMRTIFKQFSSSVREEQGNKRSIFGSGVKER